MRETYYKPLTPKLREEINDAIVSNMAELQTCQSNVFVNAQMIGYEAFKNIINSLPDGYLIPFERGEK